MNNKKKEIKILFSRLKHLINVIPLEQDKPGIENSTIQQFHSIINKLSSLTRPTPEVIFTTMQNYKLNSLYVSVKNMQRAVDFYQKLFGKKAHKVGEKFSEFRFGKVTFGLYNPSADDIEIKYGANCVPNFEVPDAEKEYKRIKRFAPVIDNKIMKLPQMKLFQFKDTEGNIIEIYSYN